MTPNKLIISTLCISALFIQLSNSSSQAVIYEYSSRLEGGGVLDQAEIAYLCDRCPEDSERLLTKSFNNSAANISTTQNPTLNTKKISPNTSLTKSSSSTIDLTDQEISNRDSKPPSIPRQPVNAWDTESPPVNIKSDTNSTSTGFHAIKNKMNRATRLTDAEIYKLMDSNDKTIGDIFGVSQESLLEKALSNCTKKITTAPLICVKSISNPHKNKTTNKKTGNSFSNLPISRPSKIALDKLSSGQPVSDKEYNAVLDLDEKLLNKYSIDKQALLNNAFSTGGKQKLPRTNTKLPCHEKPSRKITAQQKLNTSQNFNQASVWGVFDRNAVIAGLSSLLTSKQYKDTIKKQIRDRSGNSKLSTRKLLKKLTNEDLHETFDGLHIYAKQVAMLDMLDD